MKKKYSILNSLLYLTSFFVLLPNKVKEVPFILLLAYSLLIFKKNKFNTKLFLFFTLYFTANLLSLFYSQDLNCGLSKLGGTLSFLYIPFSFVVLSNSETNLNLFSLKKWSFYFNGSSFIFLIVFISYFLFQQVPISYNNVRTILEKIPLIGIHPIYLSILSVLGMLLSFFLFNEHKKTSSFFIVSQLSLLIISGTRSTIVIFIIIAFTLILMSQLNKSLKFLILIFSVLLITMFFYQDTDFKKRFREIILPVSYSKVNLNNSTSVRNAIWRCSIIEIQKSNIFIGNGIGDVPTKLKECYDCNYPELDESYNSHNEYFSIILGMGGVGLLSIFSLMFYFIRHAIIHKNKYLVVLMFFYLYMFAFENILERKWGILPFLFFSFFVFNFFIKQRQDSSYGFE